MGLGEAKPVVTPGAKEREGRSEQADQPLDKAEASAYRACVAGANSLAHDRCDIAYADIEACREMTNPTASQWDSQTCCTLPERGTSRHP